MMSAMDCISSVLLCSQGTALLTMLSLYSLQWHAHGVYNTADWLQQRVGTSAGRSVSAHTFCMKRACCNTYPGKRKRQICPPRAAVSLRAGPDRPACVTDDENDFDNGFHFI